MKVDLTGKHFGYLRVIKHIGYKSNSHFRSAVWACQCICGKKLELLTPHLTVRNKRSCGCKHPVGLHKIRNKSARLASMNRFLSNYKIRAKRRDIDWELSKFAAFRLILGDCFYCGAEPSPYNMYTAKSGEINKRHMRPEWVQTGWIGTNGIDRLNNDRDYTKDNTVSCCGKCNIAKNDIPLGEFYSWMRRVSIFQMKPQKLSRIKVSASQKKSAAKFSRNYKRSLVKRKISWNLTENQVFDLIFNNCEYCGIEPKVPTNYLTNKIIINGIDRVDNTRGYEADNVVTCCSMCNFSKHTMTRQEFLIWLSRLIAYNKDKLLDLPRWP